MACLRDEDSQSSLTSPGGFPCRNSDARGPETRSLLEPRPKLRFLKQETASSDACPKRRFVSKPSLAALFLDPNADMTFLVNISESLHSIEDAQLSGVETQILAAVHAGGAFVEFSARSGRSVRILVTPASVIRIERLPSPVDATDDDEDMGDLTFIDLDML